MHKKKIHSITEMLQNPININSDTENEKVKQKIA